MDYKIPAAFQKDRVNSNKQINVYNELAEMQNPTLSLIKPSALKAELDEYVIGNEDTKRVLCTAVYNHYKRITYNIANKESGKLIDKSNILLIGGTGSGKTYLLKTLCKCLNVPFYVADASTLTATGYVGQEVDSMLKGLYTAAGGDMKKAQNGIIIIDEVDKIRHKERGGGDNLRDVSGMDVQYELLKMMEGTVARCFPHERRNNSPGDRHVDFDTTNVLFICMGAFAGMEKTIENRLNVKRIGYNNHNKSEDYDPDKVFSYTTSEDLQDFGMLREFVGRLPIITATETLSRDAIRDILTKPKNSIMNQFQWLFEIDGINLTFEEESFDVITDYSIKNKTGARSLRTTMEKILSDFMFDMPNPEEDPNLVITADMVREKLGIKI